MPRTSRKSQVPPIARSPVVEKPVLPLGTSRKSSADASEISASTNAPQQSPATPPAPAIERAPMPTQAQATVKVAFVLHRPEANQVSVCGDFNKWSPQTTPMQRHEGGRWVTTVALRAGRYQYKFVADGQWLHDPHARENVPNEHGTLNSVIEVRV